MCRRAIKQKSNQNQTAAWYSDSCGFNPLVWQHSFVEISMVTLSLPLIQVRQSSVQDQDSLLVKRRNDNHSPSYWWKDVHQVLVNRLRLSLPRKSVVRLTDCLDMTIIVDCDVKPQNKQKQIFSSHRVFLGRILLNNLSHLLKNSFDNFHKVWLFIFPKAVLCLCS